MGESKEKFREVPSGITISTSSWETEKNFSIAECIMRMTFVGVQLYLQYNNVDFREYT